MNSTEISIAIIGGILGIYLFSIFFVILSKKSKIREMEGAIIELFFHKINKLPALIEIMKLHTVHGDICTEMIRLHRAAIVSRTESVYDFLELNSRIQREFSFLMKVSAKIQDLHRDGNFLYIRDFLMFYEMNMTHMTENYNRDVTDYNRLIVYKNYSLIGLFLPVSKKPNI